MGDRICWPPFPNYCRGLAPCSYAYAFTLMSFPQTHQNPNLIPGMTTFSMKDCLASLTHRTDKCIDFGLRNVVPFLNQGLSQLNDVCLWNSARSNTLIQIILKEFNGIQIRAFGRPVINRCNVIRPEEIHSVPSCMACGIIMPKKIDIGIILKQWDYALTSRQNTTNIWTTCT